MQGCMPPWLSTVNACTIPKLKTVENENLTSWLYNFYEFAKTGFFYRSDACLLPCSQISVKSVLQAVVQSLNLFNFFPSICYEDFRKL